MADVVTGKDKPAMRTPLAETRKMNAAAWKEQDPNEKPANVAEKTFRNLPVHSGNSRTEDHDLDSLKPSEDWQIPFPAHRLGSEAGSEYCPDNWRATLTNLMFCGFPLGAAFGGFLAAWMIPQFGWRSVLLLGGSVPLLLSILLVITLPESVRFMVAKGHPVEKIRAALSRIASSAGNAGSFFMTEQAAATAGKGGILVVLSRSYIVGSIMLWLAYFMGLVIF
jgi:hypothetical protein